MPARNNSSLPTKPAAGGTPATLSAPIANAPATSAPLISTARNSNVLLSALTALYSTAAVSPTGPPTPMATRTYPTCPMAE